MKATDLWRNPGLVVVSPEKEQKLGVPTKKHL